jgi:hypothetical protein
VPVPAAAFALWSLFVWGGRIRNAVGAGDGAGPVLLALTFVILAVAVLATRGRRPVVLALAGWTTAVWVVRAVDIVALSDHPGPFKVVHTVLAVVSIALAAWALRAPALRPVPA